jgi:ADP-ribose pyrophosphatase
VTLKPETTARREITSNRFLTYVEEDLLDRNGKPYTYYHIESKWDAVIVVPLLDDGRIVLEKIYRHPYRHWFIECPAGGIEPGEDPLHAAARELEEETGYQAGKTRLLGSYEAMPGLLRMRLYVVLATELKKTGRLRHDAMELIETVAMSVDEAWAECRREPASSFLMSGLAYLQRDQR